MTKPASGSTELRPLDIRRNERRHRIELFRLPPYSPQFNPIEGVWKETKKKTTHNRFYRTTDERDAALIATFESFRSNPRALAAQVARFL